MYDAGMKKVAYIIPGYGASWTDSPTYAKLARIFDEQEIEPRPVGIKLHSPKKPGKFSDYLDEFFGMYKKPKNSKIIVLGFSYGAMIAYLTVANIKPDVLILCSVSPYFVEDYKILKPSWLKAWRKEHPNSDFSFDEWISKIKSEIYIIVGEKEDRSCIIRANSARRKLQGSHLHIAKNAGHDIGAKGYLEAIRKVIAKL